jgi:trigger factor
MVIRNVEKKEKSLVTFQVELDKDEFEKAVNRAYIKNKKSISIPGFRKGKAPRMVIEGMYGHNVFYEDAIDDAAQEAFSFAVEQEKLQTVGKPSLADSKVEEDKSLVLNFETAVYPEVTLGQYKGLEAEKPSAEVTEADVDAELLNVRRRNVRLITAPRPAKIGDTVNIDYCGTIDGVPFEGGTAEKHNLVLGSGQFVPGFEAQVEGMSAGEERDIDILFDDDYAAPVAGKEAVFHIKLNEVKEEELPEADDEFAKDVSEFDTLEEYKASLSKELAEKKAASAQHSFEDALVEKAVSNMTADIPAAMIEDRMDAIFQEYAQYMASQGMKLEDYLGAMGMDFSTFRESSRPAAEKQVKTELLFTAVAKAEALEVTVEDIEAEHQRIAEKYKLELDKVKSIVSAESMKPELLNKKAMEIITASGIPVPPAEPDSSAAEENQPAEKAE